MRFLLDHIKIFGSVFNYRVGHACNLFEGRLHFLIQKMVIAERHDITVVDRENWAFIDVGEFLNQLLRDLTVNIHETNPSS